MNIHKTKTFPLLVCIYLAFQFSTMGIWVRMMKESFTTGQQVFARLFIACLIAVALFKKQFSKTLIQNLSAKDWSIYITRSFLNYGVGVMMFTVAINSTDIATVSFVSHLPIMGILGWLLFREKVKIKALPFVLISVIGLLLIANVDMSNFVLSKAIITILIANVGFNISYLMVRFHKKEMNTYQHTTIILCFSWIIPLIYMFTQGDTLIPDSITLKASIGLLLSSTLNVLGLFLVAYVFTNLKAYVAGNVLLLDGVFAVLIGYIVYNESYNSKQFIGAAIIILCAIAISRIDSKLESTNELQ